MTAFVTFPQFVLKFQAGSLQNISCSVSFIICNTISFLKFSELCKSNRENFLENEPISIILEGDVLIRQQYTQGQQARRESVVVTLKRSTAKKINTVCGNCSGPMLLEGKGEVTLERGTIQRLPQRRN